MNRLVLSAQVLERGAIRYTPAGLPALDVVLTSDNKVTQNGQPRKVSLQMRAVGIGDITPALQRLSLGQSAEFAGFLAPSRNGKGIVFHVTEVVPGEASTQPA